VCCALALSVLGVDGGLLGLEGMVGHHPRVRHTAAGEGGGGSIAIERGGRML
jgi:hypothetical protein